MIAPVDYHAASQRIAILAGSPPRRLIERLAKEIAEMLVADFPARRAEMEVRKFILPETEYAAVRCLRERGHSALSPSQPGAPKAGRCIS